MPAGTTGPITVLATLKYQTTSKEYVEFLDNQATANSFPADCIPRSGGNITQSRGAYMMSLWQNYGRSAPVDMASDSVAPVSIFSYIQRVANMATQLAGVISPKGMYQLQWIVSDVIRSPETPSL